MAFDIVEISTSTTIDPTETWRRVTDVTDIGYTARLGQPRQLTVTVSNPNNRNRGKYKAYQRVRVLELGSYTPFFLGRIARLKPNFADGILEIICFDYMADLAGKKNTLSLAEGGRRSDIVKAVVNGNGKDPHDGTGVFRPINGEPYQQSVQTFHVENSPYLVSLARKYGDNTTGFESLADSVRNLGTEDAWQDLQVVYGNANDAGDIITYTLATSLIAGGDGLTLPKPEGQDKLYIGSKSLFKQLRFSVSGVTYTGTLDDPLISLDLSTTVEQSISSGFSSIGSEDSHLKELLVTRTTPIWTVPTDVDTWAARSLPLLPMTTELEFTNGSEYINLDLSAFEDLYWVSVEIALVYSAGGLSQDYRFGTIDSIVIEEAEDEDIIANGWDFRIEGQECLYADAGTSGNTVTIKHPFPFSGIEVFNRSGSKPTTELTASFPNTTTTTSPSSQVGSNPRYWNVGDWEPSSGSYTVTISNGDIAAGIRDGTMKILSAPAASLAYFEKGTSPHKTLGVKLGIATETREENGVTIQDADGSNIDFLIDDDHLATLAWKNRDVPSDRRFNIRTYSLGENNSDLVTRVTVFGQNGVSATEINSELEDALGIVKEQTFSESWELHTPPLVRLGLGLYLNNTEVI